MKASLRDYLYFSKAQRRGLLLLILLLLAGFVSKHYYLEYISQKNQDKFRFYAQIIEDPISELPQSSSLEKQEVKESLDFFHFDPNTIDLDEWQSLGFSEKQAQSILNYRNKGGEFRVKSDLAKMYVVSEEKYDLLEEYILLPDELPLLNENDLSTEKEEKRVLLVEINSADSSTLIALRGIGPVYASRIIKYRSLLGGFNSTEQLTEVWGLSDSTVQVLQNSIEVDLIRIKKIDINSTDVRRLASHPYIDWTAAKAIVKYREQHGQYKQLDELRNIYLINDSLFQRILPYLAVDKKDL